MNITMFLLASLLKGLLGIGLLAGAYKVFNWLTNFSFDKVLQDEKITGADIFISVLLLGMCFIIGIGIL